MSENERKNTMFGTHESIRSRRLLTIFFAFVSGISAVSTAVLPGVLHI
jgi:hypothetical protein